MPIIHPNRQKGAREMQDEEKKPKDNLPDSRIDVFIFESYVQIHEYYSRDMSFKNSSKNTESNLMSAVVVCAGRMA